MALKENYRSGQPLAAISARWLNEVAHILNTLQIEMAPANELPSVQRPPMPGKWTLRIPQGSGEGLPVGTEIWGKVRAEHLTGTAAEQGDGTYFHQDKLIWDGAAFVTKETEDGEPVEELVAFVPDAQGGLPEGTILYGRTHLEEIKDGSTSSGGKVTGYKLTQDKLAWQDGALAETEDSPVEIGTIALPTVPEGFTFVESVSYTNSSLRQTRKRWDGSEIVDAGQQVIATAQSATVNTYRLQWDGNNVLRQHPLAITISALLGSVTTTSGMDEAIFGVTEHPANEATPYAKDTSGIVEESDEV